MPGNQLNISYDTLDDVINTFKNVKDAFQNYLNTQAPAPASDDDVAQQHRNSLSQQEHQLLAGAQDSFNNAETGATQAKEAFKAADQNHGNSLNVVAPSDSIAIY